MVNWEGAPKPTMKVEIRPTRSPQEIAQQRAADAAKIAEFKLAQEAIAKGEVQSVEEFYAKQDAAAAKAVTEVPQASAEPLSYAEWKKRRDAEAGAQQAPAPESPAPTLEVVPPKPEVAEISGDAAVFARMEGKSVDRMDSEERALHVKMMQANAERARVRLMKAQTTSRTLVETRERLLQIPDAVASTHKAERRPMPKVDGQRVYNTEYGPLMILSVDEARGVMYFATPEERRRVDAALVKDEGQSSLGAANFQNVLELTVEQARLMLEHASEAPAQPAANSAEAPRVAPQQHLQRRYGQVAA